MTKWPPRPFWMSENNFWSHFLPFQIDTHFLEAILDGPTMSIIELVRDIWMSNACVKFEECSVNPSKVIALTTKLWRGGGRGGGCVADENIIFPKTYVSREYNNTIYLFHYSEPKNSMIQLALSFSPAPVMLCSVGSREVREFLQKRVTVYYCFQRRLLYGVGVTHWERQHFSRYNIIHRCSNYW